MMIVEIGEKWYRRLIDFGALLQSPLLLAMRLFWGYQFFLTGSAKFIQIEMVASFFQEISIPFPLLNSYIVAATESIGGLMLLFGFATRLAAIPLTIIMGGAFATAHRIAILNIWSDSLGFIRELPFTFFCACLIALAFGPGKFSIDAIIEKMVNRKKQPPPPQA